VVPGGSTDLRGDGVHLSGNAPPGGTDGAGTFVIFNPASGRGRGARSRTDYLELLAHYLPGFTHAVTSAPGDEYRLADRALAEGFTTVVAVGGDGTWSHVADRIVAARRPEVRFAALPSGTGNDFGRNIGLDHRDRENCVRVLAAGRTRRVDVGRVLTPSRPAPAGRVLDPDAGAECRTRHFLNLIGFGFDVSVVDAAAGARLLRGELLYKFTALQQLFRFPGVEAEVRGGGTFNRAGRFLMVTISNGRFFGGGFPIAPDASVGDGTLHACLIGDAAPLTRARLFGAAGRGEHVASDRVHVEPDRSFQVDFAAPPRFEIDGDVYVAEEPTLRVEVLPAALEVVVP
jgi:diacylglycerol kinase (ATP)